MSEPDNLTRGEIEFRRVFGNQSITWEIDNNGVVVRSKGYIYPREKISFPNNSYDNTKVQLDSFWASSRAQLLARALKKHKISTIWEIGAGNGLVAIPLSHLGITVVATEPIYEGALTLSKHNIKVINSSMAELKLPSNSLKALGIFDVLEHIEDASGFLTEISRVTKSGAKVFVTVPAHQWLYSDFDASIGHFRRYSKSLLISDFINSGFRALEVRYFFASLILPAFLTRRIPYLLGRRKAYEGKKGIKSDSEGQMTPHPVINEFMRSVLNVESRMKLPFGLSLLGVFERV